MTPRQFLVFNGVFVLFLGIAGFFVGNSRLFDGAWSLDFVEDIIHTLAGLATLALAAVVPESRQRWAVLLVSAVDISAAMAGFALRGQAAPNLVFTHLDNPGDNLLHLIMGLLGLAVFAWSYRATARTAMGRR